MPCSRYSLALLSLLAVTVGSCAQLPTQRLAVIDAKPSTVTPFSSALVTRGNAGDYEIRWTSVVDGPVRVLAYRDLDRRENPELVAIGGSSDVVRTSGLASDRRWFFELATRTGQPLVISSHELRLQHAPNSRDMGGYRTGDGRWVKMGLLYRADQLNHLDGSELSSLRLLGLRRVIDLRQAVEREHEPDPTIPSVENLHFDVLADAGLDADAMPPGGWSLISSGGGADYMKTLYRSFVTLPSARKSYGGLLSSLIKDNGPVLFHCTAGQDRTGWGAAIILRALGVPREEIVKDYMMSVPLLSEKHGNLIKEYAAKLTDRNVSVEDLEPLFWIRSDYLDAAFDEVDRRYGSFDSYLRDGLGFDESEISALRSKYLK